MFDVEKEAPLNLTYEYLRTFSDKLVGGKRELILRGNDLQIRTGCRLMDEHMPAIVAYLSEWPDVVAADFAYNLISDEGVRILAEYFMEHDSLQRLNLMCNELTSKAVETLVGVGERLSLRSLRLNGNKIGHQGGQWLSELIRVSPNLEHLDIGETDQTPSSLVLVAAALREDRGGCSPLRAIDLSRPIPNFYYRINANHWAHIIGQMLKFNSTLVELHLQKSELVDADCEMLVEGARYNKCLLVLDLTANLLAGDGTQHLANYLLDAPPLQQLILAHNRIEDNGARALAYSVPSSRLKFLDVSFNQITDTGVFDILNSIKKRVRLEKLFLYGNKITGKFLTTLRRQLLSGVLNQDRLDVRLWMDGERHLSMGQNPVNRQAHIYYCVGDVAWPQPRWLGLPRPDVVPTQLVQPKPTCPTGRRRKPLRSICPAGAIYSAGIEAAAEAAAEREAEVTAGKEVAAATVLVTARVEAELIAGREAEAIVAAAIAKVEAEAREAAENAFEESLFPLFPKSTLRGDFLDECDHAFWGVFREAALLSK